MSPRKVLFQLHWIIGITVGIVLALVGATGAVLSFEQQIVASLARDGRQVEENGRTPLAPAYLLARVAASEPEKRIAGLSIVREPAETVRVTFAPREQRYVIRTPARCSHRRRAVPKRSSVTCVHCTGG